MKKKWILMILALCLVFCGCGKQEAETTTGTTQDSGTEYEVPESKPADDSESGSLRNDPTVAETSQSTNVPLEQYSGSWSYGGKTRDQIIQNGGIELSCTITEDNYFTGTLFSQQEISQRIAFIDISGKIEDKELYFDYTDDGWENSDYGIDGEFKLIRE